MHTFAKSHSLAGARLGFGFASEELISDLNTIKYSTNPYNINRMTAAAGIGAIKDKDYFVNNCKFYKENPKVFINMCRYIKCGKHELLI